MLKKIMLLSALSLLLLPAMLSITEAESSGQVLPAPTVTPTGSPIPTPSITPMETPTPGDDPSYPKKTPIATPTIEA